MTDFADIYPFNLASHVFQDEDIARELYIVGISEALATLTEREQGVLLLRFQQKKTLAQCGKECNVSQERIRQIEAKAIRKLRHPSRLKMMKAIPPSELQELWADYTKLQSEHEWLKKAFESITAQKAEPSTVTAMVEQAAVLDTPLENLDLSVRSYNCLRRAGKSTLGDLSKMTEDEMKRVRNLGARSLMEVVAKLKEHGFELKVEEE